MSKKVISQIKSSLALSDDLIISKCQEVVSHVVRYTYMYTEHELTELERWRLLERIVKLSQGEGFSLSIIHKVCLNKTKRGLNPMSITSERNFMMYLDEVVYEDMENDFKFLKNNTDDY